MKIPINWLVEYVDLKGISDADLSNALTMSGTENEIVKGVDFPNIVVGEVLEKEKHPNADRLNVTKVDVGKKNGGILQIVCGAPNVEAGQKVPVALVGAVIGEFEIKEAELRGVKSQGMICSESELGISDDHSGIMVLDARAEVGKPLAQELNIGGTVLEAEITPNRSDCFSMVGIAREAAAVFNRKLQNLKVEKPEVKSKKAIKVEVAEKELCPRYIAKVVEGLKIGPSPKWMQDRLAAAGVRPINNVVDVTNYVMLEWGQPMHAFDMSKVDGKIVVRRAKEGEKLTTLDGVERKLTKEDLVIADGGKVIGLAGVMGGLNSEVTEKTTTVVLEAAVFDRTRVRRTAQRLALRSEASNRFEKGIPLGLP
jgi:phenylalanyl-tRNA synthetase beta chain